MPVEVHGWLACTVIAPATAGVSAMRGGARGGDRDSSGRDITMRATSLDDSSRSPLVVRIVSLSGLVPPMS